MSPSVSRFKMSGAIYRQVANGDTFTKITKMLIPTHAHFHWLKFIKNI